ncbi:MAG TPA: energy-coupling factor transporter ATPase [bacterium]|nr:energy-coupling factor transporter ATPase [bacterium]
MKIVGENLSYTYRSPYAPDHRALDRLSFVVRPGRILGIVGPSGSGKTTLIQHFNGLLRPGSGRLRVGPVDLTDPRADINWLRRRVGLVFQFPEFQLFEETVYKDVIFGPRNLGVSGEDLEARAASALEWVGLDLQKIGNHSPFHLSGGEKRRVALACILAMQPQCLILDEPTVGLDRYAAQRVEKLVFQYHRNGKTVIFISHDMDLVARLAQDIMVLHKGRLLQYGSRTDIFLDETVMKKASLRLPRTVQYMRKLRARGYAVPLNIFTLEKARRIVRGLNPVSRG